MRGRRVLRRPRVRARPGVEREGSARVHLVRGSLGVCLCEGFGAPESATAECCADCASRSLFDVVMLSSCALSEGVPGVRSFMWLVA